MVLLHQQKRRPATQFTRAAPPRAAAARRGTYTRPMVVISVRVPLPAGVSEAAAYAALSDPRRAPEYSPQVASVAHVPGSAQPGSAGARYRVATRRGGAPGPEQVWTVTEASPPARFSVLVRPARPGASDFSAVTYEFAGGAVSGRAELDPGDGCCTRDVATAAWHRPCRRRASWWRRRHCSWR